MPAKLAHVIAQSFLFTKKSPNNHANQKKQYILASVNCHGSILTSKRWAGLARRHKSGQR
jgi:hypothetical protein